MVSSESCFVIYSISDLASFWCLNFLDLISKAIFCSLFLYRLCCFLLRASKSLLCSRCTVRISWIPVSLSPATQTAAIDESAWYSHQTIVNFHSDVIKWMKPDSSGLRYLFSNQSNTIHRIKFKANETLLVADNQLDLLNQAKWAISLTWVSRLFRWWPLVLARADS